MTADPTLEARASVGFHLGMTLSEVDDLEYEEFLVWVEMIRRERAEKKEIIEFLGKAAARSF